MSASLLAPPRVHPSLVFVAKTQARLVALRQLDGDQIFGDDGQILTAPPEVETAPDTGTTPAPDGANGRALADEIAALNEAHLLALNIDADRSERDHQRAEIARMEAEQEDAQHCGHSCDYSLEIDAALAKIAVIDEHLFPHDLACELAS